MDAKLIEARARIEAILKELDIAGCVFLHNAPGEMEVFTRLDPSYSKLDFRPHAGVARLRSQVADYGGDLEAQRRDLEATLSMVRGMAELMAANGLSLLELSMQLDAFTGAESTALKNTEGKGH